MAKAKSRPETRKSSKSNIGVIRYFQETREELRKVTWPDRDEITPIELARRTGLERDYWVMTRLNPLLARSVV